MPLQDAVTGAGILGLKGGPLPRPVPLVTVVGAPMRLPPFAGELRWLRGAAGGGLPVESCRGCF